MMKECGPIIPESQSQKQERANRFVDTSSDDPSYEVVVKSPPEVILPNLEKEYKRKSYTFELVCAQ